MTIDDIDLVEINEAFAPVVMAWMRELGADHAKVNVNGERLRLVIHLVQRVLDS